MYLDEIVFNVSPALTVIYRRKFILKIQQLGKEQQQQQQEQQQQQQCLVINVASDIKHYVDLCHKSSPS